jgi:hypothetical protein
MKALYLSFIVLSSVLGYGGTIDPQTPDTKYQEYAKDFHYVGMLCGEYNNGDFFCASAVAIDDYNILTAAHVIEDAKVCIFTLHEFSTHCIENVVIHKDFKKQKFGFSDIAIGHSKTPFKLKFYPDLYDKDDEQSKLCCIAGYGFHGTFLSGSVKHDGLRRAGSNIIDHVDNDLLICSPSYKTDKTFTSLEFLIASGDSGGGLFIDGKLAGINSCVIATGKIPSSKYGEEAGHTRVSKFIEWIKENKYVTP